MTCLLGGLLGVVFYNSGWLRNIPWLTHPVSVMTSTTMSSSTATWLIAHTCRANLVHHGGHSGGYFGQLCIGFGLCDLALGNFLGKMRLCLATSKSITAETSTP